MIKEVAEGKDAEELVNEFVEGEKEEEERNVQANLVEIAQYSPAHQEPLT